MVLTNPPFGKKSSVTIVTDEGELEREIADHRARRLLGLHQQQAAQLRPAHQDACSRSTAQAAVVVPDNVLFEGGAGETVRRKLLQRVRRAHPAAPAHRHLLCPGRQGQRALLRPQAGRREGPGPRSSGSTTCAPTSTSRSRQNPLTRADLDDFVACYNPDNRHERTPTWSEDNPDGRWRRLHLRRADRRATRSTWTSSGCATRAWRTRPTCPTRTCSPQRSSRTCRPRWSSSA